MDGTSFLTSPLPAPARLSSAQKRALFGQALAAVITTALIAAPILTPPSGSVDATFETALPAESFAGIAMAVAVAQPAAPRGRPTLVRGVSRAPIRTEGPVMARAVARKPLSRKLTGWLTGDGTHTVRPFPTVGR